VWAPPSELPQEKLDALLGPGAPFEMHEEEVLGVRMPVFVRRQRSLWDLLTTAADRFPDRPYVVFPDSSYTFREILGPVAAAARVLRDDYGIRKGDRVAIASANCVEYVIAFWATTALGAVTVALNGWWTPPELQHGIELTTPKVVLADARRLERIEQIPGGLDMPAVALEGDWWRAGVQPGGGDAAAVPVTPVDEDDPYLVLFTSGTTGRPKGALLSHRGNLHFIQSSMLGGALSAMAASSVPGAAKDVPPPPCVISASPMFHIAGMNSQIVMAPVTGMTIVYPPQGRWQESVHLQLSQEHQVTNWSLVPAQLWRLVDWPDLQQYDLSALRNIGGGSSIWPPELLRRAREVLPGAKAEIRLGYGMTETNGLGTSLGPPFTYSHPESVGRPSAAVEVEVRDPATGEALGEGLTGEVCLRTAASLVCYWDNPEATAAALDEQRWYRTGDFGYIRDGLLFLEGRRHDLIIRGGENIYPAEIENRLVEHPDIAEVAVVGVDHPTLGQEVKAFVVPARDRSLTEQDVREWAGAALASFKVPAHVQFMQSLPRNAMGKVLRQQLLDPAATATFVEE
jgi:acyl-CoA synthetase (AMP-forming)/AMP-acid ligase II